MKGPNMAKPSGTMTVATDPSPETRLISVGRNRVDGEPMSETFNRVLSAMFDHIAKEPERLYELKYTEVTPDSVMVHFSGTDNRSKA